MQVTVVNMAFQVEILTHLNIITKQDVQLWYFLFIFICVFISLVVSVFKCKLQTVASRTFWYPGFEVACPPFQRPSPYNIARTAVLQELIQIQDLKL